MSGFKILSKKLVPYIDRLLAGPVAEQAPPVPNNGESVWGLVIADVQEAWPGHNGQVLMADMAERDRIGRERYGTPLQANNGRDALVDAYQEALDATVYMRQRTEEDPDDRAAKIAYGDFLELAYRLCGMIARSDVRP